MLLVGALVAAGYAGYLMRGGRPDVCPPPSHTVEFHCTVDDPAVAGNRAVREQIEVLRNTEGGADGD